MEKPVVIGAVAYDARVVPIWEGMREYFRLEGLPIDYVLFSNYDAQVEALLAGWIDAGWNTNLAWVRLQRRTGDRCRALAMRDVDVDFRSVIVARAGRGIETLADLRGKRVALGSADSGQAAILPVHYLQEAGIDAERECRLLRFNSDVGKHGDTGTSELEVLRALGRDEADAGALARSTWEQEVGAGRADDGALRVIWTSPGYCHCNFSVLAEFPEELGRHWTETLLRMRYDDPRWRELMDQEGLKEWVAATPAILEGYRSLFEAAERQGLAPREAA